MPNRSAIAKLVREALSSSEMPADEVAARLELARVRSYWSALCPELSVEGPVLRLDDPLDPAADGERARLDSLRQDGFFQTGVLFREPTLATLVRGIEAIVGEGWPATFAFLFDVPWALLRSPQLVGIAEGVLGPGYRQIPNIWVHRVSPHASSRGWPAHTDGRPESWTIRAGGLPSRVTCWIALTDATLSNGCISLVPKRFAPAGLDALYSGGTVGVEDLRALLSGTRSIPALAGSMACWDFSVLHWSSMRQETSEPARLAVSYELLSADTQPLDEESPLLDPFAPPPSFEERLTHVGRALTQYGKFELIALRYRPVAQRLCAERP